MAAARGAPLTAREIAAAMGCSEQSVSRTYREFLDCLTRTLRT